MCEVHLPVLGPVNNPQPSVNFESYVIRIKVHYSDKDEGRCSVSADRRSRNSKNGSATQQPPLMVRSQSLFSGSTELQSLMNVAAEAKSVNRIVTTAKIHHTLNRVTKRSWELNTLLLEAVRYHDIQEIEKLIKAGANPNATCILDSVSACHIAALRTDGALNLLLNYGAEKERSDRLGRTPLHLAASAGNVRQIAILLGFSEDLQNRVVENMDVEAEEEVKEYGKNIKKIVNARCDFNRGHRKLPEDWKDSSTHHNCKEFEKNLPLVQAGWTALMAASARARPHCVKLLLAAGADTSARDSLGRTSLDVAGTSYFAGQNVKSQDFAEVVNLLVKADVKNFMLRSPQNMGSPLHTAIELESLEAVKVLIESGMPISCLNRAGITPINICVKKKLKEYLQVFAAIPNAVHERDKDERTVIHTAAMESWGPGVCIALEAGAKVAEKDHNGETPIHIAATRGDLNILNKLLSTIDQKGVIDIPNNKNETALFKAVINGHTDCVKKILKEGACLTLTLPMKVNVFHIAAEKGHVDTLKVLLDHDYNITRGMINFLTADDRKGFGPIHFAIQNNHIECVKVLLSRNAYVSLKTSYGRHKHTTPLHLAALNNNVEIAKIIIKFDVTTVDAVDKMGWTPLHTASHNGSRDVIALLLKEGGDLSSSAYGPNERKATAINMIMNNLSKPTDFMEDIFDTYIYTNDLNIQDPNCEVTIDFDVLVPKARRVEQMKVIEALLQTGDRYYQKRLLLHPLLESYLCLKWQALLPFFYITIALYGLFVTSLTIYTISVFFYIDIEESAPMVLNATGWASVVYTTVCLIVSQELLIIKVSARNFLQLETWVKFSSILLAVILPYSVKETITTDAEWPRHIATMALLLSWLEMTFLLSRFPNWGYYVLMFAKVSSNVLKILLTFSFLVVGFSLSFMVEFHSQIPFENPWAAFVKTLVMMTSEFDYDDLISQERNVNKMTKPFLTVRLIFLAFLILAAIVLMNLMVGVAVNDLHNLQVLGNIKRLEKQVEFLGSLENLVYKGIFKKLLPNKLDRSIRNEKKILRLITLKPSETSSKYYRALPAHIREAIFEKAHRKRKLMDEELGTSIYKNKLDEIHKATVNNEIHDSTMDKSNDLNKDNIMKSIADLNSAVADIRDQMKQSIQETQSSIDSLNRKINIILEHIMSTIEVHNIKTNACKKELNM